jgi:hypothetical protein
VAVARRPSRGNGAKAVPLRVRLLPRQQIRGRKEGGKRLCATHGTGERKRSSRRGSSWGLSLPAGGLVWVKRKGSYHSQD